MLAADVGLLQTTAQQIRKGGGRLGGTYEQILDFSFGVERNKVTKCHKTWSPGLILGASRAGPVWRGLGAKLGRKTTKSYRKLFKKYIYIYIYIYIFI